MMKASYELLAPATSQERAPKTDFERIGDQHNLMMRYVQSLADAERKPGELEGLVSRIIHPRLNPATAFRTLSKEYKRMWFKPDLYVVEPAAIDDLEEAKTTHDEARVEELRSAIRAMSWASHGRTDDEVASRLASAFLRNAQEGFEETDDVQKVIDFSFSHADPAEWARVLSALAKDGSCKGEIVEKPTRFVEKKIVETWKQLISNKKKSGGDWPTSYPVVINPPKLSEPVRRANNRLVNLRHIRDQLYFWRLYPKHCMYARGK